MTALLVAAVASATSLLLASLGGLVAERAGVFSIGLEGYMLCGAFTAVAVSASGGRWAGLFGAIAAGMAIAGIHAVLSITMRVNQIVSGITLNILALGATGFFNQALFGIASSQQKVEGFGTWAIPGLSGIPYVGPALFDQNIFTYLCAALFLAVAAFIHWTRAGLALRAVGESPLAAEARGIQVMKTRYAAVLFSGAAAGLGGAMLSIGQIDSFVNNMTSGRGYIALAAVIFAGWRPLGAVAACALFGLADASQIWADVLGIALPYQVLAMAPYLVTLLALTVLRRRAAMPAALGVPFVREQRV